MVKFSDLEDAFLFTNFGEFSDNEALLNKKTGEIYYRSDYSDPDEFPEDWESDDYIFIPDKYELELGKSLVFDFVEEYIPDQFETVQYFFRKKGAYSRYKDLLDSLDLLELWYEYESKKTKEALLEWCKENDIEVDLEDKND